MNKRKIQISLGIFWLLDGLLQLQPNMFTKATNENLFNSVAMGQPSLIKAPMDLAAHMFLTNVILFNSLTAITQLVIGILIVSKRYTNLGLIISIGWGLLIWFVGEGFGGLPTMMASVITGAPGAVLLYVIIALAVLNSDKKEASDKANQSAYWLPFAWAALWIGGGIYQIFSQTASTDMLSQMIYSAPNGGPNWLIGLDQYTAGLINSLGVWANIIIVTTMLLLGLSVFYRRTRIIGIILAIIVSIIFWVVGQNIGTIYSGGSTDPNSGLLYCLMGLAILGIKFIPFKALTNKVYSDLENILV